MDEIALSISHFIHLIATVLWIGGLAIFTLFIWPETRRTMRSTTVAELSPLILNLQKRFRPVANFSLVLLLGTGMVQMSADSNYDGFLTFSNTWTIAMLCKHLAFGSMVVLAGMIQFGIVPAIERATLLATRGQTDEMEPLLQREMRLTRLMLGLGILVLICTAIATAQ